MIWSKYFGYPLSNTTTCYIRVGNLGRRMMFPKHYVLSTAVETAMVLPKCRIQCNVLNGPSAVVLSQNAFYRFTRTGLNVSFRQNTAILSHRTQYKQCCLYLHHVPLGDGYFRVSPFTTFFFVAKSCSAKNSGRSKSQTVCCL